MTKSKTANYFINMLFKMLVINGLCDLHIT